MENVQHDF